MSPCATVGPPTCTVAANNSLASRPADTDTITEFDLDAAHALGRGDRVAHRLLGLGEIDHGPGLDAAGAGMADAEDFHGVAAPAQRLLRQARLQPRDQAGDLGGADVERRDQRRALGRQAASSWGQGRGRGCSCVAPFALALLALGGVLARPGGILGQPHAHAVGQPEVDRRDVAGEQLPLAVEPRQRGERRVRGSAPAAARPFRS